jgi:Mg2+ and Co2+ transporter CorA
MLSHRRLVAGAEKLTHAADRRFSRQLSKLEVNRMSHANPALWWQQLHKTEIFSVAAVVLMPPTLVASVYGMNFEHMPELTWLLGYPWALMLMLVSGILPYLFFKWRGWL